MCMRPCAQYSYIANFPTRCKRRKKLPTSRLGIEIHFLIRHLFLVRFPPKYRSPKPISLRFTGIQKPRPASRNSIDKSKISPFKIRVDVHRASDQRTITRWRIFTSGRMRATAATAEFKFSLVAHRIMRFFHSFFRRE